MRNHSRHPATPPSTDRLNSTGDLFTIDEEPPDKALSGLHSRLVERPRVAAVRTSWAGDRALVLGDRMAAIMRTCMRKIREFMAERACDPHGVITNFHLRWRDPETRCNRPSPERG